MDPETFTLRKKFLEEFYKDRVKLNEYKNLDINTTNLFRDNIITLYSDIKFCGSYGFNIKKVYSILKPLIYYLYSTTYKRKFVRENFLIVNRILIRYSFNFRGCEDTDINVSTMLHFERPEENEPDKDFLKNHDEEELSRNHAIEGKEGLYMFKLKIQLRTFYKFDNEGDYILSLIELEENGELDNELLINRLNRRSVAFQESDSDEDSDDEKIINSSQSFKSDECVICLTNQPNILFCNCGHICICGECGKRIKNKECPVCKTENTILRLIE